MKSGLFLGDKFFAWIMLAFGGALLVGNFAALIRRPAHLQDTEMERPPKRRTVTMMSIGFVISIWALASLLVK
jgi:hypothetical protein